MKHLNIRIILVLFVTITSVKVSSKVVIENEDGIGIEYNLSDEGASVINISSIPSSIATGECFELYIPESVTYNGNIYSVYGISLAGNLNYQAYYISKLYIPQSIKQISGLFRERLKTLIFENISKIFYGGSSIFYSCKLENVIVKHINDPDDYYDRFGSVYTNYQTDIFTQNTYKHANLFVPVGTWADFAYTENRIPGWSNFIHIREMAMDVEGLSESKAYALIDTKNFNYYVYDVVNNHITSRGSHSNFDESSPYNSWQIVKTDDGFALYNIGAKRYATLTTNGELDLSIVPTILPMENASNGITMGNSQFGFVLNENVNIDQSVTSIGKKVIYENSIAKYYTLDGRNSDVPHKGLNIVRMRNGETKKILVK
ncbi:MAG: hypothetical protein IJ190_10380 [Prevotella sp.]|nr:hypothetical protein [Prevotella sp.]